MALDINQGYSDVESKIQSIRTYNRVKQNISNLQTKASNSKEVANSSISNTLSDIEKQKNRLQKETKTQFDQLVGLLKSKIGEGPATSKYLIRLITKSIRKLQPDIENVVVNEIIDAIGCSQQQTYDANVPIYLKVKSCDLFGLLKLDPSSKTGKLKYEKNQDVETTSLKYPMNRQLKSRLSQVGQIYTFKGASNQDLFDISFELFDDTNTPGEYFKVVPKNRVSNLNTVADFLKDYYKRMVIVEFTSIITYLMDILTGAFSIEVNAGVDTIKDNSKFGFIIARILGLCFDERQQIDVSGVAKVGELDNLDDSFFEFTQLDLIKIDQTVTNIQNRAVEIENCGNVLFPVNSTEIINSLEELNRVDDNDDDSLINAFDNVVETYTGNQNGIGLSSSVNVKLNFDVSIIKNLPNAFVGSLFSPKILLPMLIMYKSLNPNQSLSFSSLTDFIKKFKRFFTQLVSILGSLLVREIYKVLKKEIILLLRTLVKDLSKEQALKRYAIISSLVVLFAEIAKIIRDWRECKNVLDQILSLFKLGGLIGRIPLPALFLAPLRSGYSYNRAFVNQISEFQSLGLPTGDLPDGSPNLALAALFSQLKGQDKEQNENGRVDFAIPPLAVGVVVTQPSTFSGIPI